MSTLKERVEVLLRSLGDTADEVADSLRARSIKGTRDDGCKCPIAKVIAAEIPESSGAEWDDEDGKWFVSQGYVRTPAGDLWPPAAVSEFIEIFDDFGISSDDPERPYWDLEAK